LQSQVTAADSAAQDDFTGLDVCLCCFNGGCTGDRKHSHLHYAIKNHPLVLNIRRIRRVVVRDEPPQKMTKIAIAAETEADRYNYETTVRCYECNIDNVDMSAGKLGAVVEGIMKANTFSRRGEGVGANLHVLRTHSHSSARSPKTDPVPGPRPLFSLRFAGKSLVMSTMWQSWLRPCSIRRAPWTFPWAGTQEHHRTRRCCQAWIHHT
jgi:ssDNA-binding Zn-finger/Zn-ribbon topoisomerase 1